MIFEGGVYSRRELILVVLITLLTFVGFWNSGFILPVLIAGATGLAWVYFKNGGKSIPVDWIDLLIFSLLIIELISYIFSIYRPNSFISVEKIFSWTLFYYVLRYGLKTSFTKYIFCSAMGVFAILLACGALLTFFLLKANLQVEGWRDASQFKALFSPFGFRINDWATIALVLLPFPLVAAVIFRSAKFMIWAGLSGFSLIVFSVMISFSRGAYLSLGVFVLVILTGIILLRLVKTKMFVTLGLATASMIAVLTIPIYKPLTTTMAMNKTVSQQRSTKGRLETFKLAWCKVKEHWLTGTGAYNYAIAGSDCRNTNEDSGDSIFTNNLYLQIFIEKGVGGLIVYSLLFLGFLFRYLKNLFQQSNKEETLINLLLFAGFVAYFFRELFFSSFFESNPVMIMVGVYAAMSYGGQRAEGKGQGAEGRGGLIRYSLILVILALGVWVYIKKGQFKKAERIMKEAASTVDRQLAVDRMAQALSFAPDIAPYHELAGLMVGFVNLKMQQLFSDSLDVDQKKLSVAVSHFENAIRINPHDAGFHFNLACLLFLQNRSRIEGSRPHFNKALETEPNNIEFMIGYGMIAEYSGDSALAHGLYEKAIRLDPELVESDFFEDLDRRNPFLCKTLIEKAIRNLENKIDSGYNTVFAARLGLLYWTQSNYTSAKNLFTQAVQDLPDLYRPYYYLGRIAETERDSILAQRMYQKSLYLNNRDYLAPFAMGDYYYSRLDSINNVNYSLVRHYKNGLLNFLQFPTIHRNLARNQYKKDISVTNDLILKNLVPYTRIKIDFKTIALRLAAVYKKMGMTEMESYYMNLSSRDLTELNSTDIR